MNLIVNSKIKIIEKDLILELNFIDEDMYEFAIERKLKLFEREFEPYKINKSDNIINYKIKNYIEYVTSVHEHIKIADAEKDYALHDKNSFATKNGNLIMKFLDNGNYVGIRSSRIGINLILSVVPFYEGGEPEKLDYFERNVDRAFEKKYILFFEKRSESYGESSYQVFRQYLAENENCRFILSEKNPDYKELKNKFGDRLIKKGSFEFFDALFQTKLLVSSEMPANLISGRSIDMNINAYINKIPFIFLQHGIMFGKPIQSENARMFWRNNISCNLVKMVVSSEAEKEQLYSVGYSPNELIETGLATLDFVEVGAEKKYCVFMPTYRAWEDILIFNGKIKQTTYYEDVLKVINIFKEIGKLTDLIIVPHPGYNGHIDYNKVFPGVNFDSYTNIRDQIKLYITDFSSASFDAQFRGAAIIYYWNRRQELESYYGAKAPLNGLNTNGIPIYDDESFKEELLHLYANNFKMDEFYTHNFKEKMPFDDYKNTERIIKHIKSFINCPPMQPSYKKRRINGKKVFIEIDNNYNLEKEKNFSDNIKFYRQLSIERLVGATKIEGALKIKIESPEKNDHYVVFENTTNSRKTEIINVDIKQKQLLIHNNFFKNLKGHYRIHVLSVPNYGKIKRYLVKCEIDNRKKLSVNRKPYKAISRTAPYTNYHFLNSGERDSFVRLYRHDNSFYEIPIKINSRLEITVTAIDYSHMLLGKNVRLCDEKISLRKGEKAL